MARIEPHDVQDFWHPHFDTPHFAPLEGQSFNPVTKAAIQRMPTLGAFVLVRWAAKFKTALLPWVCAFRSHDYPESLEPTHCRRCGRNSEYDGCD
jgi:hypothetical protein